MSSKKITMDYSEYLSDVEKAKESTYTEGFNEGKKSLIEDLVDYISNPKDLDDEIQSMESMECLSRSESLIEKLKILKILQKGLIS